MDFQCDGTRRRFSSVGTALYEFMVFDPYPAGHAPLPDAGCRLQRHRGQCGVDSHASILFAANTLRHISSPGVQPISLIFSCRVTVRGEDDERHLRRALHRQSAHTRSGPAPAASAPGRVPAASAPARRRSDSATRRAGPAPRARRGARRLLLWRRWLSRASASTANVLDDRRMRPIHKVNSANMEASRLLWMQHNQETIRATSVCIPPHPAPWHWDRYITHHHAR
ncbi:hypothetical protein M885DRAFT_536878 [Pelagophyceae sp. CCMP2097]|nr:hypothetical protein M885DRAFT_536878 [Pelagophyceae sp. CCMP2097]